MPDPSQPDPHREELLDEALEETFPASDPVSWPLRADRDPRPPARQAALE